MISLQHLFQFLDCAGKRGGLFGKLRGGQTDGVKVVLLASHNSDRVVACPFKSQQPVCGYAIGAA